MRALYWSWVRVPAARDDSAIFFRGVNLPFPELALSCFSILAMVSRNCLAGSTFTIALLAGLARTLDVSLGRGPCSPPLGHAPTSAFSKSVNAGVRTGCGSKRSGAPADGHRMDRPPSRAGATAVGARTRMRPWRQ